MSGLDPRKIDIQEELEKLDAENELINKALQAVRLERQRNNIEMMEVMSKIKELQQQCQPCNKQSQKPRKTNVSCASGSSGAKDIDDPCIVNQTKLNLSVGQNMNTEEEVESEESD